MSLPKGHTVGLPLEPGSSGPRLVFFSSSSGFLCADSVASYCELITLVPFCLYKTKHYTRK